MKRILDIVGVLALALALAGCAHGLRDGWDMLIDGERGLENFDRIGDANWRAEGGAIVADKGKGGHLVSKKSYRDFVLRAEFYAETTTQSGIFFRISNPREVGSASAYEANIYDLRPGQEYATGAIVDVARVPVPLIYKAGTEKGGKWSVMEVHAQGPNLTVTLNGVVTAAATDGRFKEGPISLQFGNLPKAPGGPIKWRKVQVKPL
jgi:hypothetical protein